MAVKSFPMARMVFRLILAAATAWCLWYMVKVPGVSYSGPLAPLSDGEKVIAGNLRRHVAAVASREHNIWHRSALEDAAQHIERALAGTGYTVARQPLATELGEVRNIEAEVRGAERADEIVLVGAHYDSVIGAVGANDNGSGVAAMLELARLFAGTKPARTLRFVAFVNEEPPFFHAEETGSRHYARRARQRRENIVAMFSLETIGYYSERPGSQRFSTSRTRWTTRASRAW